MALTEHPALASQALFDACQQRGRNRIPRRDAFIDSLLMATVFASGPQTYHHSGHAMHAPRRPSHSPEQVKFKSSRGDLGALQHPIRPSCDNTCEPHLPRSSVPRHEHQRPFFPTSPESVTLSEPFPFRQSPTSHTPHPSVARLRPVQVKCMARTRIPTLHGTVFLHLYHNNRDNKEHLAIVVDPAQFADESHHSAPHIRSHSLDAMWCENETEEERLVRGAYIGKLTPESRKVSRPPAFPAASVDIPAPLIRIHSECFTGETIGSMRCDCGEQLDEAIRLISQPIPATPSSPALIPGRGVVVYMRQEGRGIGLLSKIRAYNLQDLGHDTVSANLQLGHRADERAYDVAVAILRDLGVGSEQGEGIHLLTNNPDKVAALEKEGLKVVERVPMVPRSWKCRSGSASPDSEADMGRLAGAATARGQLVGGEDLDRYLRTKILRMGHMLPLHASQHEYEY